MKVTGPVLSAMKCRCEWEGVAWPGVLSLHGAQSCFPGCHILNGTGPEEREVAPGPRRPHSVPPAVGIPLSLQQVVSPQCYAGIFSRLMRPLPWVPPASW